MKSEKTISQINDFIQKKDYKRLQLNGISFENLDESTILSIFLLTLNESQCKYFFGAASDKKKNNYVTDLDQVILTDDQRKEISDLLLQQLKINEEKYLLQNKAEREAKESEPQDSGGLNIIKRDQIFVNQDN